MWSLGKTWKLEVESLESDGGAVVFSYPAGLRRVSFKQWNTSSLLFAWNLVPRTDHWPVTAGVITVLCIEMFPDQFQTADAQVRTLAIERTFWDKVTILHGCIMLMWIKHSQSDNHAIITTLRSSLDPLMEKVH